MPLFARASAFADFIYRHSRAVHTVKLALALFIAAAINAICLCLTLSGAWSP